MTQAKMSPFRQRMVEDMQIRGLEATTQASYNLVSGQGCSHLSH